MESRGPEDDLEIQFSSQSHRPEALSQGLHAEQSLVDIKNSSLGGCGDHWGFSFHKYVLHLRSAIYDNHTDAVLGQVI